MQFTQKSKEHIDSCRFCWMCHHVCPIGNATGLERNTARARALGLSLVMRDAIEYSDDIINNVYECSLCGGCMTDCVTGWDPVMFTKEARLGAAAETKQIMENCAKVLNNYKKVICYDPADSKVMKREYKEWGIDLKPEIVTFTQFVSDLIREGKLLVKNSGEAFTPQDSPLLARDLEETQPVRDILSKCGQVNEMLLNKEHTVLAGNLIMNEYMPDVIKAVANNRWINAKNMNAKTVVTESFAEYKMLSETKPEDMEIITIEEAVLRCL